MVAIVNKVISSRSPAERIELMKHYQKLYTENLYAIGLTVYPGALILNKRFSNVPAGAPILMYNWAEDSIYRERLWVAEDKQSGVELHPRMLPGELGKPGATLN
jgi:peptide/nickel transport system substrate-binding protein